MRTLDSRQTAGAPLLFFPADFGVGLGLRKRWALRLASALPERVCAQGRGSTWPARLGYRGAGRSSAGGADAPPRPEGASGGGCSVQAKERIPLWGGVFTGVLFPAATPSESVFQPRSADPKPGSSTLSDPASQVPGGRRGSGPVHITDAASGPPTQSSPGVCGP